MQAFQLIRKFISSYVSRIFILVAGSVALYLSIGYHTRKEGAAQWIISADGVGYYTYLPAVLIYNDPSYSFFKDEIPGKNPPWFLSPAGDQAVNKYYCGEAVLLLPFFAASHGWAHLSGENTNGFSQPYQFGVAIAAVFYFMAGLFFLWRLLRCYNFGKALSLVVCCCFAFGTNLLYYTAYAPSYSHVYSFAAITALLFCMRAFFLSPSGKMLLYAAVLLGLIALLRPVNLLIVLAFPFLAGSPLVFRNARQWFWRNRLSAAVTLLLFLVVCAIQPLLYFWQCGRFFVWSYQDEGFNFLSPELGYTLTSYAKGIFIYVPLTLLSLSGMIVLARRSHVHALLMFLPLAAFAWMIASWHAYTYGWSFSIRPYIDIYALFALLLATLLSALRERKKLKLIAGIMLVLLIGYNALLHYQFSHCILFPDGMTRRQFQMVFLKTAKEYEMKCFHPTEQESWGNFNDMEKNIWLLAETASDRMAHSGKFSSCVDEDQRESVLFTRRLADSSLLSTRRIRVTAWIAGSGCGDKITLSSWLKRNDSTLLHNFDTYEPRVPGDWQKVTREITLPESKQLNDYLRICFVQERGTLYVDDFRVEFLK